MALLATVLGLVGIGFLIRYAVMRLKQRYLRQSKNQLKSDDLRERVGNAERVIADAILSDAKSKLSKTERPQANKAPKAKKTKAPKPKAPKPKAPKTKAPKPKAPKPRSKSKPKSGRR